MTKTDPHLQMDIIANLKREMRIKNEEEPVSNGEKCGEHHKKALDTPLARVIHRGSC